MIASGYCPVKPIVIARLAEAYLEKANLEKAYLAKAYLAKANLEKAHTVSSARPAPCIQ
jgi:hypothetical protein